MKTKVEDLRFDAKEAFDNLRRLGRAILPVSKKDIDGKKLRKVKRAQAKP